LGIYSSAQFLGIFVGGLCGGWLYGHWSFAGVYLFCLLLAFVWLIFAVLMQPPRYLVVQRLSLHSQQKTQWAAIVAKLQALPGVADVGLVTEEGVAYLKVESKTLLDPDFIHLKEQLH
jgi:MFS family permease